MSRYEPVVKALVVDETEEEDYSMSINLYTQYIHVYSTGRKFSLEFKLCDSAKTVIALVFKSLQIF